MRQRGFTLLEVMVALLLMGLFSVMAYRALDAVLQAEAHARTEIDRWRGLATSLGRIENDLNNAVGGVGGGAPRGFRLDAEGRAIAWDRLLPEDDVGGLRRVGYSYADGALARLLWREAAPLAEPPLRSPVLTGLKSVLFRCLDSQGAWQSAWPATPAETGLPRAVEMVVELASGESIRRVMQVQ
jgi:prepilin-type N-terminal cleavage/methylation domain-containing protein